MVPLDLVALFVIRERTAEDKALVLNNSVYLLFF
jgi:hypothetical protein